MLRIKNNLILLLLLALTAGCTASLPTSRPADSSLLRHPQNLSAGDRYAPELGNGGYDVQHYTLKFDLTPGQKTLEGQAVINAVTTMDELKQISLDFVGFDLRSILVDNQAASFFRRGRKLLIDLPETLSAQAPFTLTIAYGGKPREEKSVYLDFLPHLGMFFKNDSVFVVSEPDGARYWFPCNDHPRDKAGFRFELMVPEGYMGIANGTLVEARTGSTPDMVESMTHDFYIWEERLPMATYLATVVVGPYQYKENFSTKGMRLRNYVLPKLREAFEKADIRSGEALDWMIDKLGPYPFAEFGYTTISGGWSLETQTMVLLDGKHLFEKALVHEMAHMWFGDWVSLDSWQEIWRNEGFATYFQLLWQYRDDLQKLDRLLEPDLKSPPKSLFTLGAPPRRYLFDAFIYRKGALLAHVLRKTMGDDAFFRGLRLYFERFGGRSATDAEFQAVMEEAAAMHLGEVFKKWLQ